MLDRRVCTEFTNLWKFFPDELDESGNYKFTKGLFTKYCSNNNCDNDINTINAGCLWLFNKFYGNSDNFSNYADDNINIVVYIIMWLGYKLNQKPQREIITFNDFYSKYMEIAKEYKNNIDGVTKYTSYNDLINKHNYVLKISNENMSKFYCAFKILCNMIINAGKQSVDKTYLEYAKEFAAEYQKLLNNNNTDDEDSSYSQLLSTLSNDYYKFGQNSLNHTQINIPSLPTKKNDENVGISDSKETKTVSSSETPASGSKTEIPDYNSTSSSSSILNKLIPVLSIFGAISILFGISYKYSLFGFRKRAQKQHLRERLKK
ncbi:hypothetical protein YYC_03887 [Plasmodium yoelii 17X]|uniref:YIR protein n=1 Tax=Plasmodium yoelii 17X TaxID=1323249 RepID=V7PHQ0_PLAYE|nr:hypothetical protein YYC_03887 [Plasmodium yoelii 17X]